MTEDHTHDREDELQALVDSSLGRDQRRALMEEMLRSPDMLDRTEELLRQKSLIKACYRSQFIKNIH